MFAPACSSPRRISLRCWRLRALRRATSALTRSPRNTLHAARTQRVRAPRALQRSTPCGLIGGFGAGVARARRAAYLLPRAARCGGDDAGACAARIDVLLFCAALVRNATAMRAQAARKPRKTRAFAGDAAAGARDNNNKTYFAWRAQNKNRTVHTHTPLYGASRFLARGVQQLATAFAPFPPSVSHHSYLLPSFPSILTLYSCTWCLCHASTLMKTSTILLTSQFCLRLTSPLIFSFMCAFLWNF